MWTKDHQFRENWNHYQILISLNFFALELWPTYFDVFGKPPESAASPQNFMGQSSETKKLLGDQILNFSLDFLKTGELWSTYFETFVKHLFKIFGNRLYPLDSNHAECYLLLVCVCRAMMMWCNVSEVEESAVSEDDTVEHISPLPLQEVRRMCHVTPVLESTVNNFLHYVHTLPVIHSLANDTWLMIYKLNLKLLTQVF